MLKNTWLATFIGLTALLLFSFLQYFSAEKPKKSFPNPPPIQEETLFENSDLEGEQDTRASYEQLRLRNPATGKIPAGIRQRELDFSKAIPRRSPDFYRTQKSAATMAGWTARGPGNIGGRVRALAVDVSDPSLQTLLAGGVSGGMWRTTDDGQNWTNVSAPWQLQNVSCLIQDTRPGHQNVWYFGTGEGWAASPSRGGDIYRGDGVFKSVDQGLNWSLLPATSTGTPQETDQPFDFVWNLAINPSVSEWDEVYAATAGLIYRSRDGGDTWVSVLGDPDQLAHFTDITITSDGVFYAGLSTDGGIHGIFRSINGENWQILLRLG